eukprot:gnl/TRDRNA2_/TRDRNA2_75434_c0_seq2.p2 gnl/TRDRNA2_/TRDRNA2_75434_c0~~gnl/TRDRNA2_/TRDRNA2_75434_c0_seq2.p2  ORF type:complete len:107 (-),score=11.41 gnl/TRDRNA2_/TRDRNA2_75434_c0_seq2:245-565(-)
MQMGLVHGVTRVGVGHTGPDDTEAVRIEFDASKVSYEELLHCFFAAHEPGPWLDARHKSAIWYHDDSQRLAAEASVERYYTQGQKFTDIEPAGPWRAATWGPGGCF